MEKLVEFEYLRYNDGPGVPVVENPHYFALIRFLGLISNTSMALEWNFEDVRAMFDDEELTEYSRNLHLKLLGFLGKRFPPHVTLERNLTKFLDERPIDVSVIFWDKIGPNADGLDNNLGNGLEGSQGAEDCEDVKLEKSEGESEETDGEGNGVSDMYKEEVESLDVQLYNPYRDKEYRNVQSYERLRTIRILINTCIQESKQLRSIFQGMENYSMKCKNVVPGECFFGLSPPYIGDDQHGHHYWYINAPNDEVIFKLYRESSLTGELTLLSDNSDTLCSTFKTFLNDEALSEIGQKLEAKYNALVVAEKAKLRKIRQMRSIRNQLESSWGNCAPTDEMLSGGRSKRKASMNIDYSYSRSENATRRSSRINRYANDSDSFNHEQTTASNNIVKDRSDRLALRNAKKQQIEEFEKDTGDHVENKEHETLSDPTQDTTENKSHTYCSKPENNGQDSINDSFVASSQTPVLHPPSITQALHDTPHQYTKNGIHPAHPSDSGTLLHVQNHISSNLQSVNLTPNPLSMQLPSGVIHAPAPPPTQPFSHNLPALGLPPFSQVTHIPNFQRYNSLPNNPIITTNGGIPVITHFPGSGTSNNILPDHCDKR